jgi:hypothetical protein
MWKKNKSPIWPKPKEITAWGTKQILFVHKIRINISIDSLFCEFYTMGKCRNFVYINSGSQTFSVFSHVWYNSLSPVRLMFVKSYDLIKKCLLTKFSIVCSKCFVLELCVERVTLILCCFTFPFSFSCFTVLINFIVVVFYFVYTNSKLVLVIH